MANTHAKLSKKKAKKRVSNNNLGTLFLVATPIGNLSEVSNRTIDILKNVEVIACEDTRNTIKLLSHFDIHTKMLAYHNFNEEEGANKLLEYLLAGKDVALVSDAGYPLISDPGYVLVNKVIDNGIKINTISGPSAGINALVASGLETNHYLFYGFLNAKDSKAKKELEDLKTFPYTIIFYEAPHRINKTLKNMLEVLGDRKVVVARELTKLHEEYIRGTLSKVQNLDIKGEIVVLVEGFKKDNEEISIDTLLEEVKTLVENGLKTKEAVKEVADKYKISKNDLYNRYIKK